MEEKAIKRLYYSIAEVSKITGLKDYVLRYWETEFQDLRPAKNRAGNRIYRDSDIRFVFLIKKLLYQEKYTIEGARQRLAEMKKKKDGQLQLPLADYQSNDLIERLKTGLKELLEILEGPNQGRGKKSS
jgi:DNA-binding transcriptional MerR regulator